MFRDHVAQFRQRMGWEIEVDDQGFERDAYDAMNTLYVIWQQAMATMAGRCGFYRRWAGR